MAHQFIDAQQRPWCVHLDVNVVRRVRKELNIDLIDVEFFQTVGSDPLVLVDVLACVLGPQLAKSDLSPEDLAAGFYGDTLGLAAEALLNAVIDFFQEPQRSMFRRALQKGKVVETRAIAAAELRMDRELEKLEADMMEKINQPPSLSILGDSSPNAPESAA